MGFNRHTESETYGRMHVGLVEDSEQVMVSIYDGSTEVCISFGEAKALQEWLRQALFQPASAQETFPVPVGHFWRGDIDPAECRHCRNPHSEHLHTDEASLCPTSNRRV